MITIDTAIRKLFVPLLLISFCVDLSNATENWPQWRGANLNSISPETNLPEKLDSSNLLWKLKMPGPAGASPIVSDDNIFVTSVDGNGLALLCVGTDGSLKWKKTLQGTNTSLRMDRGNSASPSPATDGKHVWVMSTGVVQCFTVSGEPVWSKDLEKEYGTFDIQFGMTITPVLDRERLYFQLIHGAMRERETTSVGWVVALNAEDGKEIWKHERKTPAIMENKHAYCSPVIYRSGNVEFLITHGGDYAIGHSLKDGSELWRCGGLNPQESYNPFLRFVASPACSPDLIVIPSAKGGPVIGLKPNATGDVTDDSKFVIWKLNRGTPDVATPVIHDGLVYLARENGVLVCVDAKTGEELYQQRVMADKHRSTPVVADGKLYLLGRDGKVVVIETGRTLKILSESDLGEEITASPAISNGKVYVRSFDSLFAFANK